jgi:osmotically inducible lipoprotein OsmB
MEKRLEIILQKEITMKNSSSMSTKILAVCVLSLSACAGMNDTQQRTLSGAGIGAGVGAVGSAVTGGSPVAGAAVGAAVGGAGGYIYDQSKKK